MRPRSTRLIPSSGSMTFLNASRTWLSVISASVAIIGLSCLREPFDPPPHPAPPRWGGGRRKSEGPPQVPVDGQHVEPEDPRRGGQDREATPEDPGRGR